MGTLSFMFFFLPIVLAKQNFLCLDAGYDEVDMAV